MVISYTDITIFIMTKKQFEKFKRISLILLLSVFIVQKTVVYFNEQKETNEIVFYSLPPQETVNTKNMENDESIDFVETENEIQTKEITGRININTASKDELQKLYRIGPALSERIIEYRNSYGQFETIEEIMEVKGIGEKTFEKIKDQICVK